MSYVFDGDWVGRDMSEVPAIWADILNKISRRFECIGSHMKLVNTNFGPKRSEFSASDFTGIQARDNAVIKEIKNRLDNLHAGVWAEDLRVFGSFSRAQTILGWGKDPNGVYYSNYWNGHSEMIDDAGGDYVKFLTLDNFNAHFLMGCQYCLDRMVYPVFPVKRIDNTDGFTIERDFDHVRARSTFTPDWFFTGPYYDTDETDGAVAYSALASYGSPHFGEFAFNGPVVFLGVAAELMEFCYPTGGDTECITLPAVTAEQTSSVKARYIIEGADPSKSIEAEIVKEITCAIQNVATNVGTLSLPFFPCSASFGDTNFDGTGMADDPPSFFNPSYLDRLERKETGLGIGFNNQQTLTLEATGYSWPFGTSNTVGALTFTDFGRSGLTPNVSISQYTFPDGTIVVQGTLGSAARFASRVNTDIRPFL